jgi:serine/threonine protein kinase/lipoprotein NlpI
MAACWRKGDRRPVEHFLAEYPGLCHQAEAAIDLIYEELCLRQELGEEFDCREYLDRFPQWEPQLEVLLQFHGILEQGLGKPLLPNVGQSLGEFHLLTELGRGALGRVFLATQASLSDRPVVLKIMPCAEEEHLALARVQHTHIVPLLSVVDHPARRLKAMCMPYFGGQTLAWILEAIKDRPLSQRNGQHMLEVLDAAQAAVPISMPSDDPARRFLTRASYDQAICWIGACVAEALQFAHERGLVHLDLKPSNVLLSADGQPMLLDFHLAREPVRPGPPPLHGLGGTPAYMSPEQWAAFQAVQESRNISLAVDGRSDIYSLGVMLYSALGGPLPDEPTSLLPPLKQINPAVSLSLSDLIAKCLARNPQDRYANAGSLAADLWRHLKHLPLDGVANRSLLERWRKWRRRRPHALGMVAGVSAVMVLVMASGGIALNDFGQQLREARAALAEGQEHLQNREYSEAEEAFARGRSRLGFVPGHRGLALELDHHLRLAKRAEVAGQLHRLADQFRFLNGVEALPAATRQELDAHCRTFWNNRREIADRLASQLESNIEQQIHMDLLDLAILSTDLRISLASETEVQAVRREALQVLDEAESMFGPSPVLAYKRQLHAEALGMSDVARAAARQQAALPPRTAWQHYALGQALLAAGKLQEASAHFDQSLQIEPHEFWSNFYRGMCAYRLGHYSDAVVDFTVCVTLKGDVAGCYYNRALAYTQLGRTDRALADYDRALLLDPNLAMAALNRGILHYQLGRYRQSGADIRRALQLGAQPALAYYNLALVRLAEHDRPAALDCLRLSLQHDPANGQARQQLDRLLAER